MADPAYKKAITDFPHWTLNESMRRESTPGARHKYTAYVTLYNHKAVDTSFVIAMRVFGVDRVSFTYEGFVIRRQVLEAVMDMLDDGAPIKSILDTANPTFMIKAEASVIGYSMGADEVSSFAIVEGTGSGHFEGITGRGQLLVSVLNDGKIFGFCRFEDMNEVGALFQSVTS
ncbi:MAG: hypothetical protein Q9182_003818 [Xanthomendoza sp. 2 TL-2023]